MADTDTPSKNVLSAEADAKVASENFKPGSGVSASTLPSGSDGDKTIDFKVKLTAKPTVSDGGINQITFEVMPNISETQSAEYDSISPLHHPGEMQKYKTTRGRAWSLEARLISRTIEEATTNLAYINLLRSWVMPFYGKGTQKTLPKMLGSPPPIITLSGYGDTMIGPVACVLETYNWRWPNDVDYIKTETGLPFPVIVDVSLSLKESWSPDEFSNFDLVSYRKGDLKSAFTGSTASIEASGKAFNSSAQAAQAMASSDKIQKDIDTNVKKITSQNVASVTSYNMPNLALGTSNIAQQLTNNAIKNNE
jgi:hypothetical protein